MLLCLQRQLKKKSKKSAVSKPRESKSKTDTVRTEPVAEVKRELNVEVKTESDVKGKTRKASKSKKLSDVASPVPLVVPHNEEEKHDVKKRYFRCVYLLKNEVVEGGCYCGKKPKQAGNKACTKICNELFNKKTESQKVVFGMYEVRFKKTDTNRYKPRKLYIYEGERIKLSEPAEVPIHLTSDDGKNNKQPKLDPTTNKPMVIRYNHYNKIKKCCDVKSSDYNKLVDWNLSSNGTKTKTDDEHVETDVVTQKKTTCVKKQKETQQPETTSVPAVSVVPVVSVGPVPDKQLVPEKKTRKTTTQKKATTVTEEVAPVVTQTTVVVDTPVKVVKAKKDTKHQEQPTVVEPVVKKLTSRKKAV